MKKERKESYRHILPHYQQPGQAYFVTWCLKDAIPPKAMARYTWQLDVIRFQIETAEKLKKEKNIIEDLKAEYYRIRKRYIFAYDQLLAQSLPDTVNLMQTEILACVVKTLCFWEGKRLVNHAFCVMPNHVHWVFSAFEQDDKGNPVYLQDIMQSVKRHSSNRINKITGHTGRLWQKESFDTTIRDEKHLANAVAYTLNNPVTASFVTDWHEWAGCRCGDL